MSLLLSLQQVVKHQVQLKVFMKSTGYVFITHTLLIDLVLFLPTTLFCLFVTSLSVSSLFIMICVLKLICRDEVKEGKVYCNCLTSFSAAKQFASMNIVRFGLTSFSAAKQFAAMNRIRFCYC